MDWQNFPETVRVATGIALALGITGTAVAELVKRALATMGTTMTGEWAGLIAAAITLTMVGYVLIAQMGVPLLVAVPAALVAVYAGKASYDVARNAHETRVLGGSNGKQPGAAGKRS